METSIYKIDTTGSRNRRITHHVYSYISYFLDRDGFAIKAASYERFHQLFEPRDAGSRPRLNGTQRERVDPYGLRAEFSSRIFYALF